jgi:hypothetical protein
MSYAFSINKRRYRKLPFKKNDVNILPSISDFFSIFDVTLLCPFFFFNKVEDKNEEIIIQVTPRKYQNKRKLFKQILNNQIKTQNFNTLDVSTTQFASLTNSNLSSESNKRVGFEKSIKVKIIPRSCSFDSITKSFLWYSESELYDFYIEKKEEEKKKEEEDNKKDPNTFLLRYKLLKGKASSEVNIKSSEELKKKLRSNSI